MTITHCKNTSALMSEVKEKFPEFENEGSFLIREKKPHSVKKGNETLNRCRFSEKELEMVKQLKNLTLLGDYEECFANPESKEIYDRIWESGKIIDEETGQKKPVEFSRFLGEKY
jgi:hypothetical protein